MCWISLLNLEDSRKCENINVLRDSFSVLWSQAFGRFWRNVDDSGDATYKQKSSVYDLYDQWRDKESKCFTLYV